MHTKADVAAVKHSLGEVRDEALTAVQVCMRAYINIAHIIIAYMSYLTKRKSVGLNQYRMLDGKVEACLSSMLKHLFFSSQFCASSLFL